MNWEAVGAVGEVLGAIGVIVTLAYLAVQVRLNSKAIENETARDSLSMIIGSYMPIAEDGELAEIYLRGRESYSELSPVEQIRFHYVCTQRLHAASMSLSYSKGGYAGFGGVPATRRWTERMMESAGFREWWAARGREVMDEEFVEFAEKILADVLAREATEKSGASPAHLDRA